MDPQGKCAMVVGGASGMAKASAMMLADAGVRLAIVDRPASAGDDVARALGGSFHPCDVTDEQMTGAAIDSAVEALGGTLHIALNTAGGGIAKRTLTKEGPHPLDEFRRVVELNLVSSFNVARLAAQHMARNEPVEDERGVIISTASIAAFEGQIGQVAYSAAKGGIASMVFVMARDLGSLGIRSLAIAPSLFATGLTEGIPEEYEVALTKDAAFPRRMGRPEEFAKLVVAIVENQMLNGACIRLDGGHRFAPK